MKIVIAPDSFKDSLSAMNVANAIEAGVKNVDATSLIDKVPMADGGEGTVQALVDASAGKIIPVCVNDPLYRSVNSFYGILGDGQTAVIEMAAASGIEILRENERNPWHTSTYGTGELIKHALDSGCRKIIIGIGGSATTDGGVGMAEALGIQFNDFHGQPIKQTCGGCIADIVSIDISNLHPAIKNTEIMVACDVDNPLTGANGAARIYAPQKGADSATVEKLEANLQHLAALIRKQLNTDIENTPGAGAAGGLGGGLMAFTGAALKKGFDIVAETSRLESKIKQANLVITGEGKVDSQTKYGKTPYGVLLLAKKHNIPVIALAGTLGNDYQQLYTLGFSGIFSILDAPVTLEKAIQSAPELLTRSAESVYRLFLVNYHS